MYRSSAIFLEHMYIYCFITILPIKIIKSVSLFNHSLHKIMSQTQSSSAKLRSRTLHLIINTLSHLTAGTSYVLPLEIH